jgi:cation diffusion facilitator CzcD-associated flavoprotein CzcO
MNSNGTSMNGSNAGSNVEYDAIVIGAGMSGLYQLYKLRSLGFRVLVIEAGSGVGGTWYWNRYPGARFDSESYSYGYSFSKELLAEWDWKEHFSGQPEIEKYCNYVAEKFDLKKDIRFSSRVSSAHYEKSNNSWSVGTHDGKQFATQFLITAIGLLSTPTMPKFEGVDDFKGASCHTGLWPKDGIDYKNKRVAVIGTGASGVQAIQDIAKTAKSLTVFQRRPNWCTPLHNGLISKEEMEEIRAGYSELFDHCKKTAACFIHTIDSRGTFEVSDQERLAFYEGLYAGKGFGIWQGNFRDMLTDERANKLMSNFVAKKIRERVKDPETAEKLIPKDHGFGTRRVPQETFYYEVYNKPHVKLVSMLDDPIQKITEDGIKTRSNEFEFDVIIYATGFDAVTGAFNRIDIRGENSVPLKNKWTKGPRTFIGMMVDDFPNMFMILGPHAALGNNPRSIEHNVEWISNFLDYMKKNKLTGAKAPLSAVNEWHEFVSGKAENLLSNEVDSWMTGINLNVDGKQTRTVVRYTGTAPEYRARCDDVAKNDFKELHLF